ncbi:MAG: DUF1015 domain-containing protein [Clostridia bacterium]|nr:DUF1015 domain-containing protein [Clostridia bacterium]
MKTSAVQVPRILLPAGGVDLKKWSVVACDQFTAQPEYWDRADAFVGDAPSTLRLVYPEAHFLLGGKDRAPEIHAAMRDYLNGGVFAPEREGFILTERTTASGTRVGLMMCVDLSEYDFSVGAQPLIRPTEGTVVDRIPPRVRIRKGAALELPHVMLLVDDPDKTLIEPLYDRRGSFSVLYDTELMQGGGHLRGYAVPDSGPIYSALQGLPSLRGEDPVLFAVGDGNHSLATARQCYLDAPSEATRYALVEVVNLYDDALIFEPIHRLLHGVDAKALEEAAHARGIRLQHGDVRKVQPFLDEWLPKEVEVDYIHGEDTLRELAGKPGYYGIILDKIEKETLFGTLVGGHVLPRKSFSMGEAEEKRYYMECRAL